ncbi:MAG: hypothetical protein PPP56_08320 [Longimonas sp.]|uniref:hypothetical protein n=1 Tax=Longimonas sp. TaxID=2039626 RepID=UPI003353CF05
MPYELLRLNDHPVAVPSRWSGDERAEPALKALLQAAAPYYNRALQAHAENDVGDALRSIENALRLFPYSLPVVEASIAVAIRHGLFNEAAARLRWAVETDMTTEWPDYEATLDEAVTRWNLFVDDTDALRAHYQQPDADVCYRELLLLARRLDTASERAITDAERNHLTAFDIVVPMTLPSPDSQETGLPKNTEEKDVQPDEAEGTASSDSPAPQGSSDTHEEPTRAEPTREATPKGRQRQTVVAAGIAAVIGILLGIGGMWASVGETGPLSESASSTPETNAPQTSPQGAPNGQDRSAAPVALQTTATLSQAQLHLLQDDPLAAHASLDTLSVQRSDMAQQVKADLKAAVNQALYDMGIAAWAQGDTGTALQMLRRVAHVDVGTPQDRLYALGMAADREGEPSVAVDALTRLQEYITPAWPHYDAQAAYALVRLLPDDEARPYAERIATRYPNTIYNNSVVQAHL